jgi:hypothetical protein
VECLEKRARNAEAREKRSKATCKSLVEKLKDQNFLTSELEEKLAQYEGRLVLPVCKNCVLKKK